MTTVPSLRLSAFAHRAWYLPGDTVRVQVNVECAREPDPTLKNLFAPPPAPPLHNYFSVDDGSGSGEADSDAHVISVLAAMAGHCRTNPAVLSYEWGSVPLELHPPRESPTPAVAGTSATQRGKEDHDADYRELFATRWHCVAEDVFLRLRQCCAFAFSFRLPANLPPTFNLSEAATRVEVYVTALWQSRKGKAGTKGQAQTRVSLPLKVYNAATSISHFSYAAAFPLEQDDALRKAHFEFAATALPPVPSSSVSAPLDDSLYPSASQARGLSSVFRDTLLARQNALAEMREPATVGIPVGELRRALEARIQSTFVAIGGSVRGVLVDCTSADGGDADGPVLVRASGALEMLECCPIPAAAEGVAVRPVHGVDGVTLLHTHTVRVQEWVLLDTPAAPFSFPLTHESVLPTILTDLGIVLWQLRIKVQWTTRANLAQSARKGAHELTMCTAGPELVVPLTVLPPRAPDRPRRGPVHSTFFS